MTETRKSHPAEDIVTNPRLRALLRYWQEKRGDKTMPSLAEIDPIEIPRLLSVCLIADVERPFPKIRLLGTEATNAYGAEMRGSTIDRFQFERFGVAWIETFAILMRDHAPAVAAGSFMAGGQFNLIEVVLLPLSREDGAMAHIFGGLLITPSQQNYLTTPAVSVAPVFPVGAGVSSLKYQGHCG